MPSHTCASNFSRIDHKTREDKGMIYIYIYIDKTDRRTDRKKKIEQKKESGRVQEEECVFQTAEMTAAAEDPHRIPIGLLLQLSKHYTRQSLSLSYTHRHTYTEVHTLTYQPAYLSVYLHICIYVHTVPAQSGQNILILRLHHGPLPVEAAASL